MVLMVRGSKPGSVFRLNGADENSATYALGWVLEQSHNFRLAMVSAWMGEVVDVDDAIITLQTHGSDGGYTDIEVHSGLRFHAIMEAKRWWDVPTEEQLRRYQPRLVGGGAQMQRLVSISSADAAFAGRRLPKYIEGAEIVHQSWGDVQRLARQARADSAGFEEKLWLTTLNDVLTDPPAIGAAIASNNADNRAGIRLARSSRRAAAQPND